MNLKKLMLSIFAVLTCAIGAVSASALDAAPSPMGTGDPTNVFLIIAILVVAAAVAAVLVIIGKKNNK